MAIEDPSGQYSSVVTTLPKSPTGIEGFDQVTGGGLPTGRPTLICGGAGCGKTLFAISFLVHGAVKFDEPGVFMSFEESSDELAKNVASLGFDLPGLIEKKQIVLDHVKVERSEIEETGDYDLEGLFIRLGFAIDSIGAKRVVLDTIESLFSGLANQSILRAELRRLFRWLKEKGVTAIITGERGEGTLTRQGLEEYVSDAVILLDHRVTEQISTRRLRIVKYRGSAHGTNEYPFLIDNDGIAVLPITSLQLVHNATKERVSTGLPWLDSMFGGKGWYRASSILLSGTAGTAKTTLASHFLDTACRRGERAMMFQFEESPAQYLRNMQSTGLRLEPWVRKGLLELHAARPQLYGLEFHLATMHRHVMKHNPAVVVVDPVSAFTGGTFDEVTGMLMRLIDFLKGLGITSLFTHLIPGGGHVDDIGIGVSSLMDTWIILRNTPPGHNGGRHLSIVKSRGMPHSSEARVFERTDRGTVA